MLTMQDAIQALNRFWTDRGCVLMQPFNTEVGAGTMNPATILRVLGPEPWRVAYVEPSVRPDDSRYGENPNRLQTHTQYQVILKPEPGDPQELYLESLRALGIDTNAHDIRFVEDNWAQPAIGAWGLGWEVWLDGLEITQFTYFQQVGGQNLDPIPVELTYGLERILMAVQGVTHFKDIQFAPGVTYGEAFGQAEYEMSRYYLDDADVAANQKLFEAYTAEAQRMVDARLPVPAHTYVLKSSHAFNVLDARGAISTTERARAFSTMRRLARDVCTLWGERRAELGYPLGRAEVPAHTGPVPVPAEPAIEPPTTPQTLVFELGVEELPPHVLPATIEAVRAGVEGILGASRLAHGEVTVAGTPRRVVATVRDVAAREGDEERLVKGPRWAQAFGADGAPTPALQGFLRGRGLRLEDVTRETFGTAEHAAVRVTETGRGAVEVLAAGLAGVVRGLRADKNMRWCDPELAFSRPIRWLVALWGPVVVPFTVSGLTSSRVTYLHRGDAEPFATILDADALAGVLAGSGIVLDGAARRAAVVAHAQRLAAEVGGAIDPDGQSALIDEITNLVETPHPIRGTFEARYLDLPERILVTVMRKSQRYLAVRDAAGALLPYFITMANGDCDDAAVAAGNESVLRARYEDAAFFWNADLQIAPADFRARLDKLTFDDRLGSMDGRAWRIDILAGKLAERIGVDADDAATLARAGELAKFDLATQTVVESSSLAGYAAREFALRAGEPAAVATALYEMEQPRTAADDVPRTLPGALLALADRLDLLVAMFAIGANPTGSSDQFGMRRAALGALAILRATPALAGLALPECLDLAARIVADQTGVAVEADAVARAADFVDGRFVQQLRDEGLSPALIDAAAPTRGRPAVLDATVDEIRNLLRDAEFAALTENLQRIVRILPAGTAPVLRREHLGSADEQRLLDAIGALDDAVRDAVGGAGAAGAVTGRPLTTFVAASGDLVTAIGAFFDSTLVMAEDPDVRAARLGLLASILAAAPDAVAWVPLHIAIGEAAA